jgi:hypothetical protein
MSINDEGHLVINATTKVGNKCTYPFKGVEQTGVTKDGFSDPDNDLYAKDSTFTIYKTAFVSTFTDYYVQFYFVVSEDKVTAKGAQNQGLFFKFTGYNNPERGTFPNGSSWDTTKYYLASSSGKFKAGEFDFTSEDAKTKYKEWYSLKGKTVANAVQQKYKTTINADFSIDYTGSEVGGRATPYQPDGESAWTGVQDILPGLSDPTIGVQLWKKKASGDDYTFFRSYKIELTNGNPSKGIIEINDTLNEGEYTLTSFLQISYNGTVFGLGDSYNAKMLVGSLSDDEMLKNGTTLSGVISDSKDQVYYQTYLGLINRGRTDLFVAQSTFSADKDNGTVSVKPAYKWSGSTNDVYAAMFGDCNIVTIFSSGSVGDVFNKFIECFVNDVMFPILSWAAELVNQAAGLTLNNAPAIFKEYYKYG